ncbi:rho guanine nucleotide exchange factor 12-like [Zophobas morio]|uniref:rho guanine nucleotide exchange factor 12-like n=1 Tax=Zophobas morio TaxID=2755281 RepID=UPI0030832F09
MASLQTRASDAENESFYLLERFLFFFYDLNIKVDMKEYMETVKLTPAELKQQPYLWLSNSASLSELSDEWDLCSPSEHVENNAECEAEQVNTIKTSARPLSTASLTNYCVSDILEVLSLEKDYESWVAKVPKDILKKTKKDEVKRQELIYELFKTERNFLSAMVALKEVFQDSIILKDLLKTEKVYSIFANLDDIVMLSYQMHRRMKGKAMREYVVSTIDDLFDEQFESYKSFAIFCSNQPIAKDILHLERKKSPALDQFLIEAERDPRCNRMKMEDMFIMPMQRITRYNLFLQNLYEKSKNAKDKERIYSCLSRVAGVLSYVNTRTKRVGNIYELKKLQDMLVLENNVKLDLCDSPRDFIRQGELIVNSAVSVEEIKKYATKHSKNAYSVEGADKKKDGQESLKKTIIVLNDMVIIGTLSKNKLIVKDEPLLFTEVHVTDGIGGGSLKSFFLLNKTKNSLTEFVCFSVAEKKAWINVISTAAKEACLAQLPMK